MKYCLPYNQYTSGNPRINEADEWKIEYNPNDKTLIDFIEKNSNKRINLCIGNKINLKEETDLKFLQELCERYDNIFIAIDDYSIENINILKNSKIKYYFNLLYVTDWDILYECINAKPTDIIIAESLGFELDKVSKILHDKNINIRVFPNVAQSSSKETNDLLKFFIRPEDVSFYENYIDTFEFYDDGKKAIQYFHIYKEKKEWFGKLKEIIIDFNSDLDNKYVLPRFAEKRFSCNKNCIKGGTCRICYNIDSLSKTLDEAGLIIQIDKK